MPGRGHGNGKPPVAERIAARKAASQEVSALQRTRDALLRDAKLERMIQASVIEESKRNDGGDVTPAAAYEVLAMRRRPVRAL